MSGFDEKARRFEGASPVGSARAKLFAHGGSQAVRLPKAFRFEGSEVCIRRDGDRVILEPVRAMAVTTPEQRRPSGPGSTPCAAITCWKRRPIRPWPIEITDCDGQPRQQRHHRGRQRPFR